MKFYVVDWSGPFTFDEVVEEKGWEDEAELYVIAHEPPTRENRTLYIGMSSRQYIAQRLQRHQADWDIYEKYGERSIRYYLGEVRLRDDKRWSEQRVKDIEAATIFHHGESLEFNIRNTNSYSGRSLTVTQLGKVPPGIVSFVIE